LKKKRQKEGEKQKQAVSWIIEERRKGRGDRYSKTILCYSTGRCGVRDGVVVSVG